ncbi:hypothetical protein D3C80_975010 [compost metagenome]
MALRSPALADVRRLSRADFACQLYDTLDRDTRNRRSPLWGFRYAVTALSKNVSLIMPICRRTGGQGFLVVSNAVFIQEWLINKVLSDHDPRQRVNQRSIRTRADRNPFVFTASACIGVARINDDHSGIRFRSGLFQIVGHPTATHARFARVITKQDHQLTVFDI